MNFCTNFNVDLWGTDQHYHQLSLDSSSKVINTNLATFNVILPAEYMKLGLAFAKLDTEE